MDSQVVEQIKFWRTENLIDYILKDLEKRVKKDKATKLSVFFTGLSAYLPEPINLFLKGESGSGKTYNVTETLKYFPQGDIWFLGGLSPKALIHDHGTFLNKDGEPLDLTVKPVKPKKKHFKDDFGEFQEAEYKEALEKYEEQLKSWSEEIRNSYTLIDLSHKILVFLEAPEYETFRMLYPILSHDTERIEYKFTDKTAKGQLRTSRVVIQGWPATIFCMIDKKYMEELATRSFTVTPEASKEKIEEANKLTNLKASLPWQYNNATEETETIRRLIISVKNQLLNGKTDVVVPFMNLHELFPKEIVRDMRDFQHFTRFLKALTVLHFYQRPFMKVGDKKYLLSTVEDVRKALEVYMDVFETTRTGTEQRILSFYHEIVKTKEAWYLKTLVAKYNEKHKKKLSSHWIRQMLTRLSEIGYVDIQRDDEDRRLNVYVPLVKEEEKSLISSVLEKEINLSFKLEEGFEIWRKNISFTPQFYDYKNFTEKIPEKRLGLGFKEVETWKEAEITIEEAKGFILNENFSFIYNEGKKEIIFNEDLKLKTEEKPKNISFSEKEIYRDNSEKTEDSWILKREGNRITTKDGLVLWECQLCKEKGKALFFNSEADLKLHLQRLHSVYPNPKVERQHD